MDRAAADTLEKVAAEFESEVLASLQEGRGHALAVVESARRETKESVSKILEAGVKQGESLKRQTRGAAELEARNAQLEALERAVSGVFESALGRIRSRPERYEGSLVRLIEEGVDVIGPKAKVVCNSKDRSSVASAIRRLNRGSARLTIGEKSIETIGGVVLTTPDGSIRFDNTLEARLERMRPSLRKEVASVLSGE